jgi:hypothetical protein
VSGEEADVRVAPGQVWHMPQADQFHLVVALDADVDPFYVTTHLVEVGDSGAWRPVPPGESRRTRADWLRAYGAVYDRVETWLTDGPVLLSVAPASFLGWLPGRRDG